MKNRKSCQNINFFPIKPFLKWFINNCPKDIR